MSLTPTRGSSNTDCNQRQNGVFNRVRPAAGGDSCSLLWMDGGTRKTSGPAKVAHVEGRMSADLQFLEEWIPEKMDPGTVFVLENQSKLGQVQNPYVAVMSCPRCGTLGLITRRQLYDGETMICGGDVCSAEYRLDGDAIRYRPMQ